MVSPLDSPLRLYLKIVNRNRVIWEYLWVKFSLHLRWVLFFWKFSLFSSYSRPKTLSCTDLTINRTNFIPIIKNITKKISIFYGGLVQVFFMPFSMSSKSSFTWPCFLCSSTFCTIGEKSLNGAEWSLIK